MQLGTLNEDTLSTSLRDISQRRRNGVMLIEFRDAPIRIFFQHGKIAEALVEGISATLDVAASLERAGLAVFPEDYSVGSYAELFADLSLERYGRVAMSVDIFKRVVKHRVLDRLYQLDLTQGARFNFTSELPDIDREYSPNIPVGQFLLDLVALRTDGPQLEERVPSNAKISCSTLPEGTSFTEDEQVVYDLIGDGVKREYLFAKTMLSKFHFQDAILAMLNQGIIRVQDSGADMSNIASALDSAIDNAFGSPEAPPKPKPEPLVTKSPPKPQLPSKAKQLSEKILATPFIPELLAYSVVAAGLIAPWFFWGDMLSGF